MTETISPSLAEALKWMSSKLTVTTCCRQCLFAAMPAAVSIQHMICPPLHVSASLPNGCVCRGSTSSVSSTLLSFGCR
ncbi:MAG: hypothetical protein Q8P67_05080 [archaeon]|nr:hypothetical protein [archaeon]